jgi:hypothetical protein
MDNLGALFEAKQFATLFRAATRESSSLASSSGQQRDVCVSRIDDRGKSNYKSAPVPATSRIQET